MQCAALYHLLVVLSSSLAVLLTFLTLFCMLLETVRTEFWKVGVSSRELRVVIPQSVLSSLCL